MKKKLLITLGCSHTEGLGCWDMTLNYPPHMTPRHPSFGEWLHVNRERFHKLGWPNRLGKKLGYDKVMNLGFAGSATSAQMKTFLLKFKDASLSEYDVTIVWLFTDPLRTSYFRDGVIESLLPSNHTLDKDIMFQDVYKFISKKGERSDVDTMLDYIREEYINRSVVKTISEFKNWNFISFHTRTHDCGNEINKIYGNDNTHFFGDVGFSRENDEELISKMCGHFNEKGYEMIASNMYQFINNNHPNLMGEAPKNEIESTWIGEVAFDLIRKALI